ncbi:MAG: nucleoside hydrolase [Actinomycetota bacterium]
MPPVPLILDVDTGVDDALALLYACASPEAELLLTTCLMGNVSTAHVVRNTLAVLELVGRTDVEVAAGAERPLVREHLLFPYVHGETGLGRAELPPPTKAVSERHAARAILDVVTERPGEVILVATGPLTNVALALAEEPELPHLLRGFVLMGGAFGGRGNVTPAAEANVWVDPEAAQAVFRGFSGAPPDKLPVCIGLDVTERVQMTKAHVDEVCAPAPESAVAQTIRGAVEFYIDFYATYGQGRFEGAAMHDPLAVAAALDPSLVELRTTRVEVETDGTWTRGETVPDLHGIRRSPWPAGWALEDNARVALDVDAPAFISRFNDRLRSLVAASA